MSMNQNDFKSAIKSAVVPWNSFPAAKIVMVLAVLMAAFWPLYGVWIPPLSDLPEHIITSKLLWEALRGTSSLDLDVPWFLGYRLFAILAATLIELSYRLGISLDYLPMILVFALIGFHVLVVSAIFLLTTKPRDKAALVRTLCLAGSRSNVFSLLVYWICGIHSRRNSGSRRDRIQ